MVVFGEPAARVRPGDLVRQCDRTIAASGSAVSLSDGIYEAPSPAGELWGRDRLQATLERHRTHTLAHSIGDTMTTARQWLGGDIFPDDVALLGVEVLDGGSASAKEKS
ncbi:MAG: SpoIIE family protein phosphatase [Nitrospira sp.]|nr:SpoIIE family protein phosphatase [Nitrospira sp.]